ncbi:MAG: FliH/SctL family protein [Lacisediminimonas sp.]|nr:FliH/SctL family protein [Lacisediminimonas sp.]
MDPIVKITRVLREGFALDLQQPRTPSPPPQVAASKMRSPMPCNAPAGHQSGLQVAEDSRARSEAFEQARRQGYQAGLEAGSQQGRQECDAALAEIRAVVHSLAGLHDALLQEMQDSAAESVFEAVTKILGRAAVEQSLALAVTMEAIAQVTDRKHGRSPLIVRVGEREHDIIRDALAAADAPTLPGALELRADPQVADGGCLVESSTGTLDARLQTQLQQLMQILLDDRSAHGQPHA